MKRLMALAFVVMVFAAAGCTDADAPPTIPPNEEPAAYGGGGEHSPGGASSATPATSPSEHAP